MRQNLKVQTFMKNFCRLNKIPTANYQVCQDTKQVKSFIKKNNLPLVLRLMDSCRKRSNYLFYRNQILKISDEIFKGKFKSSKKLC